MMLLTGCRIAMKSPVKAGALASPPGPGGAGLVMESRDCRPPELPQPGAPIKPLPYYAKKIYLCCPCYRTIHINRSLTSGATLTC